MVHLITCYNNTLIGIKSFNEQPRENQFRADKESDFFLYTALSKQQQQAVKTRKMVKDFTHYAKKK